MSRSPWAILAAVWLGMLVLTSPGIGQETGFDVGDLRDPGSIACTPESVRALAEIALRRDLGIEPRQAINLLKEWGTRATNAIPALARGLRDQTTNGARAIGRSSQLFIDFAAALAVIGVDSREALVALLGARKQFLADVRLREWYEGSKSAEALLTGVALDKSVPVESRAAAIQSSSSHLLLPQVPSLLEESALRLAIAGYLHRLGPPGWAWYPVMLDTLARSKPLDYALCQQTFTWIAQDGRSQPDLYVPLLLPLTFDEKAPYNFGYRNQDALDLKETPLAFHAWSALMNLTQDQAQLEMTMGSRLNC